MLEELIFIHLVMKLCLHDIKMFFSLNTCSCCWVSTMCCEHRVKKMRKKGTREQLLISNHDTIASMFPLSIIACASLSNYQTVTCFFKHFRANAVLGRLRHCKATMVSLVNILNILNILHILNSYLDHLHPAKAADAKGGDHLEVVQGDVHVPAVPCRSVITLCIDGVFHLSRKRYNLCPAILALIGKELYQNNNLEQHCQRHFHRYNCHHRFIIAIIVDF